MEDTIGAILIVFGIILALPCAYIIVFGRFKK